VQPNVRLKEDIKVPPQSFWQRLPLFAFLIGVVCCMYWVLEFRTNVERSMYGYLFAYVSVLSIALGAMIFVLIQHITRAGWSVAVRRVAEFAMATVPLFIVLFLPIAFLAHDIFSWMHIDHHDAILQGKVAYLNESFFMARAAFYFVVWLVIGLWFFKVSVGQDQGNRQEDSRKLMAMSAPAVILFALTVTFASIDWIMSLQPHWYSTIFGVYFFAGCFLAGLAFITMVLIGLQCAGVLTKAVTAEHYQDLGKLMFGFTVFWAYIAFSQFMLYWYANIPEETEFYLHRLDHGWQYVSYALPVTNFFIPFFFLMSRHVKRNKAALFAFCLWTLLVHFLDLFWIIMPNYGAHNLPSGALPHAGIYLSDFVLLIGMFSFFLAYVSFLIVRKNIVPLGDPRLSESLVFENS